MSKSGMVSHLQARRLWLFLVLGMAYYAAFAAVDGPAGSHDRGISIGQPGEAAPELTTVPPAERADLAPHHDGAGHAPCQATPELTVAFFRRRTPGKRPLRGISGLSGPAVGQAAHIGSARFPSDLGFPGTPAGTARTPLYDLSAAYLL